MIQAKATMELIMSEVKAPIYFLPEESIDTIAKGIASHIVGVASILIEVHGLEVKIEEYVDSLPEHERESARKSAYPSLAHLLAEKALQILDRQHAETMYSSEKKD